MEKSLSVVTQKCNKIFSPFFFYAVVHSFSILRVGISCPLEGLFHSKAETYRRHNMKYPLPLKWPQRTSAGAPGPWKLCYWCADIAPSVSNGRLHSLARREYKAIWLMAPVQVRKVQRLDLLLIFLQTARTAHCVPFPLTRAALPTALLKKKIISCSSASVSSLRAPCVWARGENGLAWKQSIFSFPDGC